MTQRQGLTPVPDPTTLTTEQLTRAIDSLKELLSDRINALKDVVDERFKTHLEMFESVQTQFKERDTRSERESKDNKVAVDAAFAAQKEAAAKQDESNAKAIDKSEKSTGETIKMLVGKIDELQERVTRAEGKADAAQTAAVTATAMKAGDVADRRGSNSFALAIAVAISSAVLAVAGLLLNLFRAGVRP